ncbi:MAG: hypothetical protein RI996_459 [Candidatus Parcubacteria bacterium]|jgi:hypothetical protein
MSDEEKEIEPTMDNPEVNADAIAEAFSDDSHIDDIDDEHYYASLDVEDEDDDDIMDTNFEIMNDDKSW